MLQAMAKKAGIEAPPKEAAEFFLARSGSLSGADIEAILVRARMKSTLEGDAKIDVDDLKRQ